MATPLPYPIHSIADVAARIDQGEDPWFALGCFLHDWWYYAVDHRQEIRIQGSLVEDALAQPIAGGDGARPQVVGLRVTDAQLEERGVVDLPQIQATQCKRERPDRSEPADALSHRRLRGLARVSHARDRRRTRRLCGSRAVVLQSSGHRGPGRTTE